MKRFMTKRLGSDLTRGKKMVLAALGLAVVAGSVAFGAVRGIWMYGQILHATGPRPSFEVATIKPSHLDGTARLRLGARGPGGFYLENGTVKDVMQFAYGIRSDYQISGLTGWMTTDKYDIDAKLEDSSAVEQQKLSGLERFNQYRLMLQSLLADRFKLKVSQSTREVPVFELVVAKDGPKLKPSEMAAPDPANPGPPHPVKSPVLRTLGPGKESGTSVSMSMLAESLSRKHELGGGQSIGGGRLVIDKTGLTGIYDWTLVWTPDATDLVWQGRDEASLDRNGPGLFTAIQEQLGLKLIPAKGPVEVLVIDHIKRPTEN